MMAVRSLAGEPRCTLLRSGVQRVEHERLGALTKQTQFPQRRSCDQLSSLVTQCLV